MVEDNKPEGQGRCRSCGASLVWIKLTSGNVMPCDPRPQTVITAEGKTLTGYTSHFATCPYAASHRKQPAQPAKEW